jgi:Mg2+-importing ATPase
VVIMAFAVYLPYSPLAEALGFVPLPGSYWPLLALTLICYVALTQAIKTWMVRKAWV